MQWLKLLLTEVIFIAIIAVGLGFVKKPRFLSQKKLAKGFPWGYYKDQVPNTDDPGYFNDSDDFLHDVQTQFGGQDYFGDEGNMTGFGQMGEF